MSNKESRYDQFIIDAKNDIDHYRKKLSGDGSFEYISQIDSLILFEKKVNKNLMVYLFEEQMGEHLWVKFVIASERNLLKFLASLTSEYKFFILYEIKNNKSLFAYC